MARALQKAPNWFFLLPPFPTMPLPAFGSILHTASRGILSKNRLDHVSPFSSHLEPQPHSSQRPVEPYAVSPSITSLSPCSLSPASGPLHLLCLLLGTLCLQDLYSDVPLVRSSLITLFEVATYPTHTPYPPPLLYFLQCTYHSSNMYVFKLKYS